LALAAIDSFDDVVVVASAPPTGGTTLARRMREWPRRAQGGWTEKLDPATYFLHDVSPRLAVQSSNHALDEADTMQDRAASQRRTRSSR
jgi:hypothetical protein